MVLDEKEKKRRYLLRVAGARDGKAYVGPETVHLHVTNRCNLSCRYCWYHSPGNPLHHCPPQDISFEKFREIADDCKDLKVDSFYFSASGEPTLHPRFSEMMAFLEKKPFEVTILTNGTFSGKRFDAAKKADRMLINLGAVDRESYRLLQGEDLFDKVVGNIRQLTQFRDDEKPSLRIEVVFVVNKMNIQKLEEAKNMLKELRVDSFMLKKMTEGGHNQDLRPNIQKGTRIEEGKPSEICFNGWFYSSINLDGKVCPCCQVHEMEAADISNISFREAWFSREFMRARLQGRRGQIIKNFYSCQECLFKSRNTNIARKILRMKA